MRLFETTQTFLDLDNRPQAKPITSSQVRIAERDSGVFVSGRLGAIPSDFRPGEYVAFAGIEIRTIPQEFFYSPSGLSFRIASAWPSPLTMTFQLIDQTMKSQPEVFAKDISIESQKNLFVSFRDFQKSRRGKWAKGHWPLEKKPEKVRILIRRSQNHPLFSNPLPFQFQILPPLK